MLAKNPLDVLFKDLVKDTKRELWAESEAKAKAHAQGRIHVPPRQSTYANPQNWRTGRAIELVHATEGSLGTFQEYFHRLSPTARRLLPAAAGVPATSQELVFGEFWLHPKFQAMPEPESEAEIRAINARFKELIDKWAKGEEIEGWYEDQEGEDD